MQNKIIKIVTIGPESTGKSSICESLAKHYETIWCKEYAREYLLKYGKHYRYEDLLNIAKGQIDAENSAIETLASKLLTGLNSPESSPLLFLDTDMYVMKVWCEFVFGKCHPFINEQLATRKYDLYLLCNPDLPWERDELREYPDERMRMHLYDIYKQILKQQTTPYIEIKGKDQDRFTTAVDAIDRQFLSMNHR